jgi:hypothetical protein
MRNICFTRCHQLKPSSDCAGFSCIVGSDGSAHPLARSDAPDLIISSRSIAGGFLRVLPDEEARLAIEFDALASLAFPAGDDVRLAPAFAVSLRPACRSVR